MEAAAVKWRCLFCRIDCFLKNQKSTKELEAYLTEKVSVKKILNDRKYQGLDGKLLPEEIILPPTESKIIVWL